MLENPIVFPMAPLWTHPWCASFLNYSLCKFEESVLVIPKSVSRRQCCSSHAVIYWNKCKIQLNISISNAIQTIEMRKVWKSVTGLSCCVPHLGYCSCWAVRVLSSPFTLSSQTGYHRVLLFPCVEHVWLLGIIAFIEACMCDFAFKCIPVCGNNEMEWPQMEC